MTASSIQKRIDYAKELLQTAKFQIIEVETHLDLPNLYVTEHDLNEWLDYAAEKISLAVKGINKLKKDVKE